MLCLLSVTLQQHIRFTNGIGLRLHFLAKQMNRNLLTGFFRQFQQAILRHGQHTTRTAGSIIAGVGGILDLILDRNKNQICHQFHHITRRVVFTSFFVVGLVELANQFFKDSAHGVVIQSRQPDLGFAIIGINRIRAEVDFLRHKFFNDCAQNIGFDHCVNLVSELELLQNLLYIWRKTVQVCGEIGFELLLLGAGRQITQTEGRSVAKRLSCSYTQCLRLIGNPRSIQFGFHVHNLLFRILQNSIQTANHRHRQNHITILATHIHIAQTVISNAPNKAHNLVVNLIIHISNLLSLFSSS